MSSKLKNYTSNDPQCFNIIQKCLLAHGAQNISQDFSPDGLIRDMTFKIKMNDVVMAVKMPARYENAALIMYGKPYENCAEFQKKQAYRTAWANIRDWLTAQMALLDTEQVKMAEVFLPYILSKNGDTFFEHVAKNPQLLLN